MRRRQLNEARQLTTRQEAILRLLADGCTTAEMASLLYVSPRTVKYALQKLGFRTRPQAVAEAMRHGWIK
jgi:two-component system, NarL family, response regulator DegU